MVTKIAKTSNFWYKFTAKKKSRGFTEKLEYRCTTRNLPLCNGIIIVVKITPLHSPKRDKNNKKRTKKPSHFFVYSLPMIPTILGMVIEEICPIFAPPNFF